VNTQKDMDPRNGFGFLTIGFWIWLLPALAPEWFPVSVNGGINARALWLEGMGVTQMLLGGAVVLRHIVAPSLVRWASARKPVETAPTFALTKMRGGARL